MILWTLSVLCSRCPGEQCVSCHEWTPRYPVRWRVQRHGDQLDGLRPQEVLLVVIMITDVADVNQIQLLVYPEIFMKSLQFPSCIKDCKKWIF